MLLPHTLWAPGDSAHPSRAPQPLPQPLASTPLSADQSTSSGSFPSRNWASPLSRHGDWLSALAIGSVGFCDISEAPDCFPNLYPLCAHLLHQFCHGLAVIHHNSSLPNSWNGAYDSWSRVPGLRTCVSGLTTSAFSPRIKLSSGIDQDPVQ